MKKIKLPDKWKTNLPGKWKKDKDMPEEDDGLDILMEAKEPFSFSNFFETQVVERGKRIKKTMAERGILFFLFSPFQARARLIAELFILLIGVMFGVIPRASSLVNALQDQAYASEIEGLSEKVVGNLTITPAASSNYKKLHMIAFVVEGKNLPSDASKYEVHLARSYGASDWADVTYSWTLYPVTDTKRILLVGIDQSRQKSGYGAFNLYVQLAGDEVKDYAKIPFEITLSTAQETTELYDRTGIHLSVLTQAICGTGNLSKKQAEFEEALSKYQVAVEQAEAMPVTISVSPKRDELENYCLANRVYRTLEDTSTTEDIIDMEKVSEAPEIDYAVVLTSNGIEYDTEFVTQLREAGGYSDEDAIRFSAFDTVDAAKTAVITAMNNVNTEAISWYSTLDSYKLILNQTIQLDTFPLYARCTSTIEDEIEFIEGQLTGPSPEEETSLSGTMKGDSDDTEPAPPADVEGPPRADAPVSTDTEEPADTDTGLDEDGEDTGETEKETVVPNPESLQPVPDTGDPADSK